MNYDTSNLTRYVENSSIPTKLIKKAESTELRESISKCNIRIRESVGEAASGWWVPISFYGKKNANERIYGKKLWENVVNSQRDIWVGAPMLVDHPSGDSDGSPKDICGVWLDAKIDPPTYNGEGLVYGLLIPSGHLGDDLKDHLNHGLKVGTSSSGFGKLLNDGVTVDPDTFVIERPADWVLNPSQGTFFSYEEDADGEKEITNKSINESVEHKEVIKEKFVKDSKIAKLEEKKFRRDMESFLEDACNMKDPQERLSEFKEIESYLEDGACPDLKEKIEQKIAEEEEYIRTALREKAELRDELKIENPKDLKKKLTKIVEDSALLNKEAKDWKKISEKLQNKLTSTKQALEDRPTEAYVKYLKEKHNLKTADLNSRLDEATATIKNLEQKVQQFEIALKEATAAKEELEENKKLLEATVNKKDIIISKYDKLAKAYMQTTKSLNGKLTESCDKVSKLSELAYSQRASLEKNVNDLQDLRHSNDKLREDIDDLSLSNSKLAEFRSKVRRNEIRDIAEREATPVSLYYESLRDTFGSDIEAFKKTILDCRTLAEAKRVFFKDVLQNLSETKSIDETRLPENYTISPEDRAKKLGTKNFRKAGVVERLPKGWY